MPGNINTYEAAATTVVSLSTGTTILMALAVVEGMHNSKVMTESYTITG